MKHPRSNWYFLRAFYDRANTWELFVVGVCTGFFGRVTTWFSDWLFALLWN